MDYNNAADRIAMNGEPGFAWLDNMRKFGRIGDPPNYKDSRAQVSCFHTHWLCMTTCVANV